MSLTLSDMFNPLNLSGDGKPSNFKLLSMDSLLITIGGPVGQLYMRFKYYNGSLDKLWLLLFPLFWIPPFSFIPLIWVYFGWMHKIPASSGKLLDYTLLFPIISKLILPFIMDADSPLGMMGQFTITIFILLTMFFLNIWHKRDIINASKCSNLNITSVIGRALAEAMFHFACATLPEYLLRMIPIQGEIIGGIMDMPLVGGLIKTGIWIAGYIFGYVFTHMYSSNFTSNVCDPSYRLEVIIAFLAFIVACMFNFADLIPGLNFLI